MKRRCKYLVFFFPFILISISALTQNVGGSSPERAFDMISDGTNLYMTGFTKSFGTGNRDGFLLKYNTVDNTITQNTWGKIEYDEFRSICKTNNSLILGGFSFWRDGKSIQSILAKADENLEIEWLKDFGNDHYQHAYSTISLNSGDYLLGGVDRSIGLYGPYIIKTNSMGEMIWEKTYAEYMPAHTVDMLELENNNVLLLSAQGGFFNVATIWHMRSHQNADILLIEIDSDGNIIKDTIYYMPHHDIPVKVLPDNNGNYYILSHSQSYTPGNSFDICLSLISSDFDIIWTRTYGGTNFEYAADMGIDTEGNINIIGTSASTGKDYPVMYYLKTNTDGTLIEESYIYTDYKGFAAGIEIIDSNIYIFGTITIENDDNLIILKNFELKNHQKFVPDLYIYPNPAIDNCKIVFNSLFFNNTDVNITVFNSQGQIVADTTHKIINSKYSAELDLSGLLPGQYFIKTYNNTFSETTKIIIVK
ncbi:MAG: T9SS type A sorting domain-containing protein [Bacteroidales bacterium]|nr:T9SS type A sorting domain-containing protein [Bacteroidales bacterium]